MLKANKITHFIDKSFSAKSDAIWKPSDYTDLLIKAASHDTYAETVKSPTLPDADMLHLHIEEDTGIRELHANFIKLTKRELKKHLKGKHGVLIIDYTHEPFYGYTCNPYIHGYRPKKGCTGSFCFLSASILFGNQRYFIDAVPVHLFTDEVKAIDAIIDKATNELKLRIEIVLMDRGFARSSKVIELLNNKKLGYLGLFPKYENVKTILSETDRQFLVVDDFEVKGVRTKLVVIKTSEHDWTFVTNNVVYKRIWRYLRVYRKRWNIETGFRVQDEARIKTKSVDIRVRYFLFLVAMLLYNAWKSAGLGGDEVVKISFKRFVIYHHRFRAVGCGGVLGGRKGEEKEKPT